MKGEKTVMCFGDSNTWGAGTELGVRYDRQTRWPGVLQRELGDSYHVIEEGLPGRNTVWLDGVEGGKTGIDHLVPLIHSHSPLDLLIIMLGTNDFKNRFNASPTDIAWGIGRLVKTAKDGANPIFGPPPEILVICPPPLADLGQSPFQDILNGAMEKSQRLPAVLAAFCKAEGIRMFDAGTVVQTSPVDGVHWEKEEHEKLGVALAPEVRAILNNQ